MKNVAILVVTYNRLEMLKQWINRYSSLEGHPNYNINLYIVNNASNDGTEEYLQDVCSSINKLKYITLDNNKGGAGGFSAGLKWVFSDENDYVWGMDDDAFPHEDSFVNLMTEYEKLTDVEGEKICLSSNSTNESCDDGNNKLIKSWMFVGFFIPREIYEEIGNPREDFFIYCDDAEYAKRICKKNYKIFRVFNSVIDHSVGGPEKIEKRKLGKLRWCYKLPDWKQYYFVRNRLLMCKLTEKRFWGGVRHNVIYMINVALVNPKQFRPVFKGIIHGIFRISGKRMEP